MSWRELAAQADAQRDGAIGWRELAAQADAGQEPTRPADEPPLPSHPAQEHTLEELARVGASQVLGVDPSKVDFAGPGLQERLMLGLLDSPETVQAYLAKNYPQAETLSVKGQDLVAFRRPDGSVSYANPPGADWGDVAEFPTREGPAIAGGLIGGGLGGTPGAALGAALGETIRRGLLRQEAGGEAFSAEDLGPVAVQGLLEGAGAFVGGKLLPAPVNLARGRGVVPEGTLRDNLLALDRMKSAHPDMPLPPFTRLSESPVSRASEQQVRSTTAALQQKDREAQQYGADMLRDTITETKSQLNSELRTLAEDYVKRAETGMRWDLKRPQTGGAAALSAAKRWSSKSKVAVNKAYAEVDRVAEETQPIFDFSAMRGVDYHVNATVTKEVPVSINAQDIPLRVDTIREYIDVAPGPEEKVSRVLAVINKMDDVQTDYRVVKELRTQVGDAIERWPWDADQGSGIARKIYGDLTDVMNKPANLPPGNPFTAASTAATAMAKHRFGVLDNAGVKRLFITGDDHPSKIVEMLVNDPRSVTPEVATMLKQSYNAADRETLRLSFMDRLVTKDGSAQDTLKDWWSTNSRQARDLFGGNWQSMNLLAKQADRLKGSRVSQIAKSMDDRLNISKMLVQDLDEAGARSLVTQYGGAGTRGHELLRLAVHEGIIDKAIRMTDEGVGIDLKALKQGIEDTKKSGAWSEILTRGDHDRLGGLEAFAYFNRGASGDAGVSLQRASAVADLRHPATFMRGFHTLSVNRILATALSSDKLSRAALKFRLGSGKQPMKGDRLRDMGVFLGGITDFWLQDSPRQSSE